MILTLSFRRLGGNAPGCFERTEGPYVSKPKGALPEYRHYYKIMRKHRGLYVIAPIRIYTELHR